MSDTEPDIAGADEKNLKLRPVGELKLIEQDGQVYSQELRQLQIRPGQHQVEWFNKNFVPWRNRKAERFIAKGDPESLRTLSDMCIKALGKVTWQDERSWLLRNDQLNEGEQPLKYKPLGQRKDGDHDGFYPPLETMWREMRTTILVLKASATPSRAISEAGEPPKTRKKQPAKRKVAKQSAYYGTIRTPQPATRNEQGPPGKWTERQSEEAMLHIIKTISDTRLNSDERIFQRVFVRFLARLEEIEYVDELDIPDRTGQVKVGEDDHSVVTGVSAADCAMPMDISDDDVAETAAIDTHGRSIQSFAHSIGSNKKLMTIRPQSRTRLPISGSLKSYLPASYPETIAVYITPFPTISNAATPYSWIDAPCLPFDYSQFVSGVRLRANVPDALRDNKMAIVLAYGWNDFCRVLKEEADWTDGFQRDIRLAVERDRVDIWRMRVCCIAF